MRALFAAPNASVRAVCERFGRSRSTVYRYAPAPTWGPAQRPAAAQAPRA